jgi:hypothetical protein
MRHARSRSGAAAPAARAGQRWRGRRGACRASIAGAPARCETPIEPEARTKARATASVPTTGKVVATVTLALPEQPAHSRTAIEPEAPGNPGENAPTASRGCRERLHEDLGAHEATQQCVTMRHSCAGHASPSANRT